MSATTPSVPMTIAAPPAGAAHSRAAPPRAGGGGGLDGVRMALRADVDGPDVRRVDLDLGHRGPRRLHGDRDHVLVGGGDALRADIQGPSHGLPVGAPHGPDVLRRNPVARNVPAVADDADLHAILSSRAMSSSTSRSVRARRMFSSSASFTASSSMFSGFT